MSRDAPLNLAEVTITELRHRIKNLVAITQALVSHSLREASDFDEAAHAIEQRLNAVARSVDIMLLSDWGEVSLDELVRLSVAHSESFPGRVTIAGPPVLVGAEWATMLILALHELETNALKCGALSNHEGCVHLNWSIIEGRDDARDLWLQWTEHGGSRVEVHEPSGFGSRLATTLLERQVKGKAGFDLVPSGLTWRLVVPLPCPAVR